MAITAAGMAAAITAAQGAAPTPEGVVIQNDANLKIATGIVDYLKASALVTGSVVVASGSSAGTWPVSLGRVT